MNRSNKKYRTGFILLELVVSTATLAMITTASMVLVRTSYTAWNRHEDDNVRRQAATAVMRHIARKVRQTRAVVSISAFSESSGSLSVLTPGGETLIWEHDSGTNQVRYGVGTATEVVATNVESLQFLGYDTLLTPTTDPGIIHSIMTLVRVDLDRPAGADQEFFLGFAHLRSW